MTNRAAIYTRLSRYRGAEDPSTSPERQRASTTHYCHAKGWEIVKVLEDLDVSGSEKGQRLDRPGLQAIRRIWDEIDVIVVPKLDRLARSVVDFHLFAEECRRHGVDLVSVHEGLDMTTAGGRFVATILAAFAQMESETISERTRGGRQGAAMQGRWGGPAPYGYRLVAHPGGKGKSLAVEPTEAEALRQAAAAIVSGVPLSQVSRRMTLEAPKPRRAETWTSTPLRQMLTGETILGRLVVNGAVLRDDEGVPLVVFPPILDPDTADAVRAALARAADGVVPAGRDVRLLTGLLTCSGCGGKLTPKKGVGSLPDVYRCAARGHGRVCVRPVTASAPAIERHVTEEFLAEMGSLPLFERQAVTHRSDELVAVEDEIAVAAAELAREATPELFERLRALQAARAALAVPAPPRFEPVPTGLTVADAWAEADVAARRTMLADHYAEMLLLPGKRGRQGFDPARLELSPESWFEPEVR